MYRQLVKCCGQREEIEFKRTEHGFVGKKHKVRCNNETGYMLVSSVSNKILIEARYYCSLCGKVGVNEDALWWDTFPAASSYQGPTVYQMALAAM